MTKMLNIGNLGKIGPGPGKYLLPTNVGYEDHDCTKNRAPFYSIAPALHDPVKSRSPGPKYQLEYMTRVGKASPPAYSMVSRPKPFSLKKSPGPAEYLPQRPKVMPCYSMSDRHKPFKIPNYPGPDKYLLPSTLGPKVPDKHSNAAYSMSYKHYLTPKATSPGPATYTPTSPNKYKQKYPNYSIRPYLEIPVSKTITPGPKYYPKLWEKPGYSFGLRLENMPYITAADDVPCA
ncbi:outer dense fiber protein 3-like [Coccinella septempunctata]|uniref:outer dense fiber protein 3-like n=1 Tax=Coccinella septempunctata TaxID=41139 RepID=UPI001D066D2A|nr:outer dense fiber protein 3-like [Coccinella septempunctata]